MVKCIGEFFYKISANDKTLNATLTSSGKKIEKFGKKMSVASAGIAAFYAVAIKKSMEFNKSMGNVATLVDGQVRSMDEYKKAVQEAGIATGTATDIMADGLYQVVSAYGETSDTIKQLEINAKAAKAGVSTVTDAVNLTSAVTKAYGDVSAVAQERVADLAFTAVKLGQTTFPELASSVQSVTSTAERMNVSQEELFGVMATLTGVTGNASMVTTQLRSALVSMDAPTASLTALYKKLGVETGAELIKQKGIQGAFAAVTAEVEASGKPMSEYIGRVEGQNAVIALAGQQAEAYKWKLDEVKDATGAMSEAFKKQTEGVNKTGFAYEQTKIKLTVLTQQMGDELLPIFNEALIVLSKGVEGFSDLDNSVQKTILMIGGIIAIAGPAVFAVGKITQSIVALRLALMGPAGFVVAGTAAAAVLVGLTLNHKSTAEEARTHTKAIKELVGKYNDLAPTQMYLHAIVEQQDKVLAIQKQINEEKEKEKSQLSLGSNFIGILQGRLDKEQSIFDILVQQNSERLNAIERAKRRAEAEKETANEDRQLAAEASARNAQAEKDISDLVAAEQATAVKRIAIQADMSAKIIDLNATTLEKIDIERVAAIEKAQADGVNDRETMYLINKYYDDKIRLEKQQGYDADKILRDADEAEKLMDEQARAAIRIEVYGTEAEKGIALIEKEKQAFIDAGFSMDEADALVQEEITKRHLTEAEKRKKAYTTAVSQTLGMANGFLGQMISISQQETQNKINNLNEASMSEEEFQKTKAFFNYKGSVEAWRLQVMQAKLQIPMAMINAYTSTASLPFGIGPILAPIMAAIAGVFAYKQYQAVSQARPPVPKFAEGGSFIVPDRPQYRNDGFPMQVEAGEQVDVTPADQVGKSQGGAVYLDGKLVGKYLGDLSKNGQLRIASRSIV